MASDIAVGTIKGATAGGGASGLTILISMYFKRHGFDIDANESIAIAGLLGGPIWFIQEFGLIVGLIILNWARKLLPANEQIPIVPPTQGT